jgi:uncharacterized protein (TIGR03083 family)
VAHDPVGALRRERSELLRFCADLSLADWQTPSAADGWRVQDVVAHMGSAYRALFGPAALELMRSNDIERTNDALVDHRRVDSSKMRAKGLFVASLKMRACGAPT